MILILSPISPKLESYSQPDPYYTNVDNPMLNKTFQHRLHITNMTPPAISSSILIIDSFIIILQDRTFDNHARTSNKAHCSFCNNSSHSEKCHPRKHGKLVLSAFVGTILPQKTRPSSTSWKPIGLYPLL